MKIGITGSSSVLGSEFIKLLNKKYKKNCIQQQKKMYCIVWMQQKINYFRMDS
jgi:hypothetical protein